MLYTKVICDKIVDKIKNEDKFSHAEPLTFFNKRKNGTLAGGLLSFLLGIVIIFLTVDEIQRMLLLKNSHLTIITT